MNIFISIEQNLLIFSNSMHQYADKKILYWFGRFGGIFTVMILPRKGRNMILFPVESKLELTSRQRYFNCCDQPQNPKRARFRISCQNFTKAIAKFYGSQIDTTGLQIGSKTSYQQNYRLHPSHNPAPANKDNAAR